MPKKVLHNANIYTANDAALYADALVIDGDTLTFVGNVSDIDDSVANKTSDKWIDVGGRMIIPGFCDSHNHPGMVSQSSWHVALPWTHDLDEILAFVKDYAEKHPKEEIPFLYF
jgi:predicted amidohydrolase YtcJ